MLNDTNQSLSTREKREQAIALTVTTILLGLVSVITAFSGYQASTWNSKATSLSSKSNKANAKSIEALLTANQLSAIDVQLFSQWLNAFSSGDDQLADKYRKRFRAEMKPAFEKWLAGDPFTNPGAPPSPFSLPEYVLQSQAEAIQFEEQAVDLSNEALLAREKSVNFSVNTILLTSTAFFAGMSPRSKKIPIELALAIVAVLLFAWAVFRIILIMTG